MRNWCKEIREAYPDCGAFAEELLALLTAVDGPTQITAATAVRRFLAVVR